MKECNTCKEIKPLSLFSGCSRCPLGITNQCKKCKREYQTAYREKHRARDAARLKERSLLRNYGVSLEQYNAMVTQQGGKCKICLEELTINNPRNVALDHCHSTGAVRGILCRGCNQGLGGFRDNVEYMKRAIKYLQG